MPRRFYYFDEQAESWDEMVNPKPEDEYIDYRTYPLKIDWPLVEDLKSEAFHIFKIYGYLGISLFTSVSKIKNILKSTDKFLADILNYYTIQFNKSCFHAEKFIKSLPNLNSLYIILERDLLSQKEMTCFTVIISIYFHFYNNCLAGKSPLSVILTFYKSLKYEDVNYLFDKIKSNRELFSILRELNIKLSRKKSEYIIFYQKIEEKSHLLEYGIKPDRLII